MSKQPFERIKRDDILVLYSIRRGYICGDGQTFYQTPRSYEIWQDEPLALIKRLARKNIYWVSTTTLDTEEDDNG